MAEIVLFRELTSGATDPVPSSERRVKSMGARRQSRHPGGMVDLTATEGYTGLSAFRAGGEAREAVKGGVGRDRPRPTILRTHNT